MLSANIGDRNIRFAFFENIIEMAFTVHAPFFSILSPYRWYFSKGDLPKDYIAIAHEMEKVTYNIFFLNQIGLLNIL